MYNVYIVLSYSYHNCKVHCTPNIVSFKNVPKKITTAAKLKVCIPGLAFPMEGWEEEKRDNKD